MKFVFMGTPQFAVYSLRRLMQSSHQLVAVVTVPDKPAGRGRKIRFSPVKEEALKHDVPILQPERLNETGFISTLKELNADVFVVVAFRILPEEVFLLPPKGTVNLHASLLPKYRGAAPINWAIINGEKETGVTTIFIRKQVDAGDILLQEKVPIADDETAGELHDRLARVGAETLCTTLDAIASGDVRVRRQPGEYSRAPKITRELCRVQWNKPANQIRNLIRGLSPVPGAFSFLHSKQIKFYRAEVITCPDTNAVPGRVVVADRKTGALAAATGDGCLKITELQPEGKRRMSAREFLLGHAVKAGDMFEPK